MKPIFVLILFFVWQKNFGQKINSNIWKKDCESLQFWNSGIDHRGDVGYIDSFTISNTHFRIIHHDTLGDGIVQLYNGHKWINNITFGNLGNHNDYDISNDLDDDGNKDLIFYWKWFGEIHFFVASKQKFSDSVNCTISVGWELLDAKRNIFFEDDFGKLMKSPVYSNLFTFKNNKRIEIANLELFYDTDMTSNNGGRISKYKLYLN